MATEKVGTRVGGSTAFEVTVDQPVDPAEASTAIRLEPEVPGTVVATDAGPDGATTFVFTPDGGLRADTRYRLVVAGLHDSDGAAIVATSLLVRTAEAPSVVRFRPRADTIDVARDATLSVRFTDAMDRGQHDQGVHGHGRRQGRRRDGLVRRGRHGPRLQAEGAPAVLQPRSP